MDAETPPVVLDPGLTGQLAQPVPGVDNGYLAGYRVRFDEAGPDGIARASTLLRYAQDVAWRHSEALGFDRAWYAERGLGWVVRGVDLELHEPIPMGQTLRVSTAVVGHRRIWARRLSECRLVDGRLAARITTDWVLLDGRGRIVRIPADFGVAFTNPEIEGEIIRVPASDGPVVQAGPVAHAGVAANAGAAAHAVELAVRPSDLDPLDHVNNAVYVDWLDEALLDAGWSKPSPTLPRILRLEYLASAAGGDSVVVSVVGGPGGWEGTIRRADGLDLVRARGRLPSG